MRFATVLESYGSSEAAVINYEENTLSKSGNMFKKQNRVPDLQKILPVK